MNKELQTILTQIKTLAKEENLRPQEITKGMLLKNGIISEWMLRKFGGVSAIMKAHFPVDDKDLLEIKKLNDTKKYISKLERELSEKRLTEEMILTSISEGISKITLPKVKVQKTKKSKKRNMTMELMISDVHYGKKSETFNLAICRKRMVELAEVFIREVESSKKEHNVEHIIIALLGDIIESYTMHGVESALSSEFSNSVQVKEAIESLFFDIILPISSLGIPITIPAVSGNHDRVESNRTMQNPGENNLTWIIYNSLNLLIKQSKLDQVKMIIPKDSFVVLNIYGNNALYEHTDNVKASTEVAFENHIQKRSTQIGKVIDFLRGGHWHKYLCYGRGRIIINESVPGQDSYARVLGYDSHAGQTINYYIETKERPTCFYKSFPVYLK